MVLPVLVLGALSSAGSCLLRELLFRKQPVIALVTDPGRVPADLWASPLLTLVQGEITNEEALAKAMGPCLAVFSLLSPSFRTRKLDPSHYSDIYRDHIFPTMRKYGIRRIIAIGNICIARPNDQDTLMPRVLRGSLKLLARSMYQNTQNLARTFEEEGDELKWTLARVSLVPTELEEEEWKISRDEELYEGNLGDKGWGFITPTAAMTKWMVDNIWGSQWISEMPALSAHVH
ncbi:hypothetical protein B0I35DRAFT_361796 [Stachybotrys elegans]|uniref:NAD(P)-binding domain-containing protein n=1 Tax=Stachybotrys elegans TaxID=80388 RepID=A0A8K0WKN1_9HYPO|nr:hypothetical protein B0I35DRAFT_361796 [Stachybotrys elegans]